MASKLDIDALVAALDARRKAEKLSWRELAKRARVSPSTLSRMQQGKRPDVDTFAALLGWLNMPAENFLSESLNSKKPHPLSAVSSLLRGKKEMSPQAEEALNELVEAAFKLFQEIK